MKPQASDILLNLLHWLGFHDWVHRLKWNMEKREFAFQKKCFICGKFKETFFKF